jgi:hypothetical protein
MPAFVRAAVNGQWVSLPASTLKALSGFAQGFAGAQGVTPPTPNPAKLLRFSHQLLTTLLSDLSVTRVSSGAVDHLALSFQLRRVLSDEYAVVRPFIRSFVPFAGTLPPLRPTSIPPVTPHLDAYVTGGALSKVVLDAGQFDTKHHFSFPVVLSLSRQGPAIAPPSGAIPVNLPQIGQLLGSVGA